MCPTRTTVPGAGEWRGDRGTGILPADQLIKAAGGMPEPPLSVMSFVRAVLGDISPDDLGVCHAHEHIIIDPSYTTAVDQSFLINDVEVAVRELGDLRKIGVCSMIDSMPCDCGRNVVKLAEVAQRTGINIVCPTGLHLSKYYDPGHWGNFYSTEELTKLFVTEITEGVDARDCNGPFPERSMHRAGLIKIATGERVTPREERVFAAAAAAHGETGSPILTHTEQGTLALEQVAMLYAGEVDLRHVVLSHTDRKPDLSYHREILSTGVKVECDSCFRWKPELGNPTLDLIVQLIGEFPNQIMLDMDAARRSYWKHYGGSPGLCFLLDEFVPMLQGAGVGNDHLERIFVDNPMETYQFTNV